MTELKEGVNPKSIKMNVFEAIATRRSIRKFTAQDVPMELLGIVLDAGRYAPSAGNLQNWRFIIIKRQDKREAVAEACMQQLWIAQAPVIIVVVSEMEKISNYYGRRGQELYAIQNCAAAVQNMILTAHSLGMSSTWIGSFDEHMLSRSLGIPETARPQAVLPIGFPDEVVPAPTHLTLEDTCFFEGYGSKIINIERVMQNPLVFEKISRFIGGFVEAGKDIVNKAKSKK